MGNALGFPILSLLVFLPVIGSLFIGFGIDRTDEDKIKKTAFIVTIITMLASFVLLIGFDFLSPDMQFIEKYSWIPSIGVEYLAGIDGISLLLILLTTILSVIAIVSSYSAITFRNKEYYISLLLLETGMLGVFISMDLFLFYIFWEVMLVPMYFLIGIWGGGRRLYSAIKFFLYTLFGSVFLLIAILALYFLNHNPQYGNGEFTFSILELYNLQIPLKLQILMFIGFFLGFAIKVPMFPFHTWLPDAHTDAPTAASVILAGVMLKMGAYGFIRLSLPLFPDATKYLAVPLIILSIVGIIYGALCAMAQSDIKKLVAYSSVSHLGFVMLGIFALNHSGITGGVLQMINHGISTGALFLLVGMIYERRHTREISEFGGLAGVIPVFTVFFAITTFSSIGLPGLNGFIGEFLILIGIFQTNPIYALFAVSGIILGAAYMLWLFQRLMFGELNNEKNKHLQDCNAREVAYMLPLILLMFWIGLYPKPFLNMIEPSIANIVKIVEKGRIPSASAKHATLSDEIRKGKTTGDSDTHQGYSKSDEAGIIDYADQQDVIGKNDVITVAKQSF